MKHLTIAVILTLPIAAMGQTMERQVIGSAGSFGSGGGITLSSTVGESVINTHSANNLILTQGFQQTSTGPTVVVEQPESGISITAYPNPTQERIVLQIESNHMQMMRLSVFDPSGKLTVSDRLSTGGITQHSIDFSGMAAGQYILVLTNDTGEWHQSIKILKTN